MSLESIHRLGHWSHTHNLPAIGRITTILIRLLFAAWIPSTAKVGARTRFGYGGLGVVVHGRATIGEACLISHNVTIGGTSKKAGVPTLGNRVFVGAGAKILGPVVIGDDVVIGANAVVVSDLPSNCVAVGVPARIVKTGTTMEDYV